MDHAKERAWIARRIEIACLSGFRSLDTIEVGAEEDLANAEIDPPLREEAEKAYIDGFVRDARAQWQRALAEEATWTARTPLDRFDDALGDLARDGLPYRKIIRIGQENDITDEGYWTDENDPLQNIDDAFEIWIEVELAKGRLRATATIDWPQNLRRDEFDEIAAELIRVFAHHGHRAVFDEKEREIVLEPFPFQKRRASVPPGDPIHASPRPPKPAPCEICKGKGWVQLDAASFPEVCLCKGGKPLATATAPTPSTTAAPSTTTAPSTTAAPSTTTAPSTTKTATFQPIVPSRAALLGRGVAIGAAVFALTFFWKKLPPLFCALGALVGGFAAIARPLFRAPDVLVVGPDQLECRSGKRVWQLPYDRMHRAYQFGDRWVFESTAPHQRFSFLLDGHDANRDAIVRALEERATVKNLAWVSSLASLGRVAS